MSTPLNTIFSWFETGDFPTQAQFQKTFSSFYHKADKVPFAMVEGLTEAFQETASAESLRLHFEDPVAHKDVLATRDATNITQEHAALWKDKLGITYNATIDSGQDADDGNVYTKAQIGGFFQTFNETFNQWADVIDGLGPSAGLIYNDAEETVATGTISRIDKRTGLPIIYQEVDKRSSDGAPLNLDHDKIMTDDQVDGFIYIKIDGTYYINTEFKLKREVYDASYHDTIFDYVPIPEFKTIAEKYPEVTLAQVQELDPEASLNDSSDWYILARLNKILPINTTLYFTQHYALTRPVTWRRSYIKWVGKPWKRSSKHPDYQRPIIRQTTPEMDCIAIKDGDGETCTEMGRIISCDWENIILVGTKRADLLSGDGISIDVPNGDFLYCNFKRMIIANHGKNGIRHYNGHVNDINFYDVSAFGNFDTGMYWDGRPSAQTNQFDFKLCSFSSNGSVIRNGELVPYDWHIDGDGPDGIYRTTKGGMSVGNMSATAFETVATQENHGFGILTRENSSMAGLRLSVYGEGDPLGSLVILSRLDSEITINSSSTHTYGIYPEVMSPEHWIYASFKSMDHYRKFVQRAGIEYAKDLTKIPWTQNLITDSKHRKPSVGETVTRNVTYSVDATGSVVTTVEKTGLETVVWLTWLTYEEVQALPYFLNEGDLVTFALDVRFDYIHDDDKANFASSQFGVRRFAWGTLSFLSDEDAPTFDGEWKRVQVTYEHKGVYDENALPHPFIYMGGTHPVTFSVRNPEMRLKARNQVYSESIPAAGPILKGIVNQSISVADVQSQDATDLDSAIILVNEIKAQVNSKLRADRNSGQQASNP